MTVIESNLLVSVAEDSASRRVSEFAGGRKPLAVREDGFRCAATRGEGAVQRRVPPVIATRIEPFGQTNRAVAEATDRVGRQGSGNPVRLQMPPSRDRRAEPAA